MLVLTRKSNEKIILHVGETEIEVVVAQIRGEKVRIGIEAPQSVQIYREEVLERDRAAQQQANNRDQDSYDASSTSAE